MASQREVVSFQGILRGEGHEAGCRGTAMKVSLPGTNDFEYTRYSITSLDKPLPEGNYTLSVHGKMIPLRYQGGHWLAQF
jgi:hypothetical protein